SAPPETLVMTATRRSRAATMPLDETCCPRLAKNIAAKDSRCNAGGTRGRDTMMFARTVVITALFAGVPASVALAQTVADFYRGKSIELDINVSVGGGYDLYARVVARHIGKHIPANPTILSKNMEGGGGMRLANWVYNAAAKDGTAIGALARATAFEPLLGNKSAQYDGTKFNYIGSANDEVSVCVAWYTSGVKTFGDAQQMQL